MAYIDDLKMEAKEKAHKLEESLLKKYKGDLAAMYADVEATARNLENTAETPAQIKKSMAYNYARDNINVLIINRFMRSESYTFTGNEDDIASYGWKKEGADNGNDSNN